MARKREKMWAIWEDGVGLYCGTYMTRKEAIFDHRYHRQRTWKQLRRDGVRAVRVLVSYDLPEVRDAR